MITLFILFGSLVLFGKLISFFFKLFFAVVAFIIEFMLFMFLLSEVGLGGIVLFLLIDFFVLKLFTRAV